MQGITHVRTSSEGWRHFCVGIVPISCILVCVIVCVYVYIHIYIMIQEESAIFCEMIVCVILSQKIHINMGPILNGYRNYGKMKIRTILRPQTAVA
jgi:uncharacterized membrane protein